MSTVILQSWMYWSSWPAQEQCLVPFRAASIWPCWDSDYAVVQWAGGQERLPQTWPGSGNGNGNDNGEGTAWTISQRL